MDVALCYESVLPARGGAETYIGDLARRLARDGHAVHLYAGRWDADSLPASAHFHRLEVPAGRPIRVLLTSEDVIHSFWLREHRVKQDAVPGMEIQVWFEATEPGEYPIGCAELCGTGYTRMRGTLIVHSAESYQQWLSQQTAPPAPPAQQQVQPAQPPQP